VYCPEKRLCKVKMKKYTGRGGGMYSNCSDKLHRKGNVNYTTKINQKMVEKVGWCGEHMGHM
jgi:hypothetical protein